MGVPHPDRGVGDEGSPTEGGDLERVGDAETKRRESLKVNMTGYSRYCREA